MPECSTEFTKYVECITNHSNKPMHTLWCRHVLKNLNMCIINDGKPGQDQFIFKDMPSYVN